MGYGDITPTTVTSRVLTIFFVMYGVALGGLALRFLGEYLFSQQEAMQSSVLSSLKHSMTKRSRSVRDIDGEMREEEVNSCCNTQGCQDFRAKVWGALMFTWNLLPFPVRLIIEHHILMINALVPIALLVILYAIIISQIETGGDAPFDFSSSIYFSVITLAGVG